MLTALRIDVELLGKNIRSEKKYRKSEVETDIHDILETISKITRSIIRISTGLRPEILDELGILEAIEWLAIDFEKRTKIKCRIHLPSSVKLEKSLPITLFRVVQEALTNVARHSKATSVGISIGIEDRDLHLEIRDNGKGIESGKIDSSYSLGLIGIRERIDSLNGTFKISGKKGIGTILTVSIPMKKYFQI